MKKGFSKGKKIQASEEEEKQEFRSGAEKKICCYRRSLGCKKSKKRNESIDKEKKQVDEKFVRVRG